VSLSSNACFYVDKDTNKEDQDVIGIINNLEESERHLLTLRYEHEFFVILQPSVELVDGGREIGVYSVSLLGAHDARAPGHGAARAGRERPGGELSAPRGTGFQQGGQDGDCFPVPQQQIRGELYTHDRGLSQEDIQDQRRGVPTGYTRHIRQPPISGHAEVVVYYR